MLQKLKNLQEELKRERDAGKRVAIPYDKIVELKRDHKKSQPRTHTKRNKQQISMSPEEAGKETIKSTDKGTTPFLKKNKSQIITSFLRPSQLNLNTQVSSDQDTEKN